MSKDALFTDNDAPLMFLRAHGHRVGDMIPVETVRDYLKEYTGWLEMVCNRYHRIACDALNLKLPDPIVVGKSELPPGWFLEEE